MSEPKIQQGQAWLEELLNLIQLPAAVSPHVETEEVSGEEIFWLTVNPQNFSEEQIMHLIGDKGNTIDAIQYLVNITMNLGLSRDEQHHFTVDINNYRINRFQELKDLATQIAQKVRETQKPVEIEDLSSAERRQMHTFFKAFEDLETESRGQEPNRHLIVHLH